MLVLMASWFMEHFPFSIVESWGDVAIPPSQQIINITPFPKGRSLQRGNYPTTRAATACPLVDRAGTHYAPLNKLNVTKLRRVGTPHAPPVVKAETRHIRTLPNLTLRIQFCPTLPS